MNIKQAATAWEIRSGGFGGLSHSGRMSAENTIIYGLRRNKEKLSTSEINLSCFMEKRVV